ncbi:hypothetical protein D3C79_939500 [compost metagenome]
MHVFTVQQQLTQGIIVHHRATAGIDQPRPWAQPCQLRLAQQVPGGVLAAPLQGGVQADHIALFQYRLEADVIAPFGGLTQRVAHQHFPAQAMQHTHQAATDLPRAHHAVRALG